MNIISVNRHILPAAFLWFSVLLLLILFAGVLVAIIGRMILSYGFVWIYDLQHYAFGLLILASTVIAFLAGKHVKITRGSQQNQTVWFNRAWMLFGVILPFSALLILAITPVFTAWQQMEGSTDPQGMPGYFLVKTALPLISLLFILIAIRRCISNPAVGSQGSNE
ncbi:MAG: TRAP transporter small permease subunit [Pseudomonadota bacterium]